jgi:alkylation response protein AidB-like acyl-CoA dehydrogenase
MDLTLTDEQHAFQALVREFLEREVVPHRARWDREESVDTALVPRLGDIGILGLTLPEEWGGSDGDYLTYALMMEELGRADSAVRGIVSVSLGLVATPVATHGTDEQKKQWLPALAQGTALGCFGLTEPDTGSDAGQLRSRAERQGEEYVLNGS